MLDMTRFSVIGLLVASIACATATSTPAANLVIQGTWGGDNAGLIVNLDDVHVHIGCTLGDANGPVTTDMNGHFDASGTYNVDAYPINRGIEHPARFSGDIVGNTMTLTVSLTDTARTLGPVVLTFGKQPQMGPCPICRVPKRRVVRS